MYRIKRFILMLALGLSLVTGLFAWNVEELPIFTGDLTKVEYKVIDESEAGMVNEIFRHQPDLFDFAHL